MGKREFVVGGLSALVLFALVMWAHAEPKSWARTSCFTTDDDVSVSSSAILLYGIQLTTGAASTYLVAYATGTIESGTISRANTLAIVTYDTDNADNGSSGVYRFDPPKRGPAGLRLRKEGPYGTAITPVSAEFCVDFSLWSDQ